ncbi:MAG: cyclodeaminase/cyclohydrolase family protein, partial [Elusimicrobiaceae bacterium]|nr:cyclodeaminase/cyclohydrolase family protein [Elusimicrobiaceae bacterium]
AFVDGLASDNPAPGGGAASAICASTGTALAMMALSITLKNKDLSKETKLTLKKSLDNLYNLKEALLENAKADAKAYEQVVSARKLPKTSKERPIFLQAALKEAALVPTKCAQDTIKVIEEVGKIENKISKAILSDVNCAKEILKTALICCTENIKANQIYIKDEAFKADLEKTLTFISKFC